MQSSRGNDVPNQFVITGAVFNNDNGEYNGEMFQSYDSNIAFIAHFSNTPEQILLDQKYWACSTTTGKYRNQFLGETKKETQAKIDSGEYILTDLN